MTGEDVGFFCVRKEVLAVDVFLHSKNKICLFFRLIVYNVRGSKRSRFSIYKKKKISLHADIR